MQMGRHEQRRAESTEGHVFLAHGRMEDLVHDAAVVPTAADFHIRRYWEPLLGSRSYSWQPVGWPASFGRSRGHDDIWFIDVGDAPLIGAKTLAERAVDVLREIAKSDVQVSNGRARRLVAMPILGIAGGGLGGRRGEVVKTLLQELGRASRDLNLDVVLVTPDPSVYAAAQHVRRENVDWPFTEQILEDAKRLGRLARDGELALFMGAGVSIPAGLPTWDGLLERLAVEAGTEITEDFQGLTPIDQAQLLERRMSNLGESVGKIAAEANRPSLAHVLLAALSCREVITTNYDGLYEQAVDARGGEVASVLPWQPVRADGPWILKMHGDRDRPKSIVLTRRHLVRYDAGTRPAGSLLQSLLLTRHVLIVGASLTDDNVARLVYEVDVFRRENGLDEPVGTMLDIANKPARRELWSDQLHWVEMLGSSPTERARTLEVFLDAVAAFASDKSSWLLDERFSELLSEDERRWVREARNLYSAISDGDPAWEPLRRSLEELGADASASANRKRPREVWRNRSGEILGS